MIQQRQCCLVLKSPVAVVSHGATHLCLTLALPAVQSRDHFLQDSVSTYPAWTVPRIRQFPINYIMKTHKWFLFIFCNGRGFKTDILKQDVVMAWPPLPQLSHSSSFFFVFWKPFLSHCAGTPLGLSFYLLLFPLPLYQWLKQFPLHAWFLNLSLLLSSLHGIKISSGTLSRVPKQHSFSFSQNPCPLLMPLTFVSYSDSEYWICLWFFSYPYSQG